ncbi:hypothetical protein PGT21_010948 [Puccinia graminis f. sp. tritici]|uniref:Uncharacterized protein n=1 Tax=Puccinia graminis f. sp. tritici TaxID=56615 RepID=A0A5B0LW73_PUCGR|nr:hypothetical protein PGT21_010948 [Puccinia graminis f. sp. tritici]KAA1068113.1 hypothetical protein PGTUg99_018271 [Puccinia graminis f. sp. tritici]
MISNRTETLCIEFVISLGRGKPSCASCEHCGGECRGGKLEAQYYVRRIRISEALNQPK